MQKWEELAYAKEDGREEGRAEGKAEGIAELILEFLSEYGEIPEDLKEEILSQKDLGELSRWSKLAARAGSIEEFIKKHKK